MQKLFVIAAMLGSSAAAAQGATPVFPGQKGGQDIFGHYAVVEGWPKPLSQLPGHGDWTFGAMQSVHAETADRIFVLQRGELPVIERPPTQRLRELGPSLSFPVFRLPFRDATRESPPAGGGAGPPPADGLQAWVDAGGELGVDARWEHCILVFDRDGNIIETWTQWDAMLARPHAIYISPYDDQKHVWIVDDSQPRHLQIHERRLGARADDRHLR